ncbi:hypothetical protein GCM10009836_72030 [Pseudonocardia ailaonensis]|uniref:Uncharacterized protein n=1 Tax=Pseudonocardia ailaonensis TaxID=367279 RepID=A0ABN2NTJ4_9PSEU
MTVLTSPAWIIGGLRNRPGYLATDGVRITFTDGETTSFDVPLAEITDVTYPWYWFGGGVKLRAGGELQKITFVKPNGMPAPDPSVVDIAFGVLGVAGAAAGISHAGGLRGLADIAPGRAATKRWREILPS